MKHKFKTYVGLLFLVLFLAACGSSDTSGGSASDSDEKIIKVANYFAAEHPQNIALKEKFKPLVEENTDYIVEIYPNSELGSEEQFTTGVRNGTIEMAVTGMILQTAKPKLGVIEWPFLFEDYDQAKQVLDGEIGQEVANEYVDLGAQPLAWTANGFRVVSSNRAIESIEDFDGLRLRMANADGFINTGKAMGASVQGMPISEVFTALEQGVIDAQENPYATLKESAYYEVQSHVLESNHIFSPNLYIVNKKFFDGLDEETQKAIEEAAQEAADYEWELIKESEDEVKSFLEEKGVEIIVPDEQFKQSLVDAMDPVYEGIFKQYDWAEDLYNRIQEEIK